MRPIRQDLGQLRLAATRSVYSAVLLAALFSLCPRQTIAQETTLDLGEMLDTANEWAAENLDPDVLQNLRAADQDQVRAFLKDLQTKFQGTYVLDLASLREPAKVILPLLDRYEETAPYAAWLKAHMDYLDVADELNIVVPPPEKIPEEPPVRAPNPTPQKEREIWISKFTERPWPPKAKDFVPKLKPVFTAEKVPPELVWVAEVESSFDPSAQSPAGAAGLFQLMPATAKDYGLRRWPFDERYRPEPSARAAAKHLAALYRQFKDWRLALAAYNAGQGTVQRLLDKYKTRNYDTIAPYLPAETQMYVPKVEASIRKREGLTLSQLKVPKADS